MKVELGEHYRLRQHVGFQPTIDPADTYEQFLNRHWPVFEGQVGVVDEIVPAEVDGAGTKDEDHCVLVFEARKLLNHAKGKAAAEHVHDDDNAPRRISFTQAQIDTWFVQENVGSIQAALSDGTDLPDEPNPPAAA